MKVICISTPSKGNPKFTPIIKEGSVYTVIDSGAETDIMEDWYELAEHKGYMYSQKLFIPLSTIDETELIKEREEVFT